MSSWICTRWQHGAEHPFHAFPEMTPSTLFPATQAVVVLSIKIVLLKCHNGYFAVIIYFTFFSSLSILFFFMSGPPSAIFWTALSVIFKAVFKRPTITHYRVFSSICLIKWITAENRLFWFLLFTDWGGGGGGIRVTSVIMLWIFLLFKHHQASDLTAILSYIIKQAIKKTPFYF